MRLRKKQMPNKARLTILVIAFVIIFAVALALYMGYGQRNDQEDARLPGVSYSPATDQDQESADEQKSSFTDKEENASDNPTQKVSVFITYAAQVSDTIEVNAYTDYYADGTCLIEFVNGDVSVKKETPAYKDASTSICTNPVISRSEFPVSGTWHVSVTFKSEHASGTSESKDITIN